MTYKVLDELPGSAGRVYGRWAELYKLLETLPEGKWIEVPVTAGDSPLSLGKSIIQSARVGRKPFKISYRTLRAENRLFVTRRVIGSPVVRLVRPVG